MTQKKEKPNLKDFGFAFRIRRDHSAGISVTQAVATCSRINPEREAGHPYGISSYGDGSEFDGLQITTYFSDYAPYGINHTQTEFDTYGAIDEHRAKRCADVLGRIRRGVEKKQKAEGREHSYGQYIARVCAVLGFTRIWIEREEKNGRGQYWSLHEIGQGVDSIDYLISYEMTARAEAKSDKVAA
ncbi:MAG: hypothetical protein MOB07_31105 [Acidobacteria bacterium]|nr:hypothetical protein [Acidobacteriota bacterium]